MNCLCASKLASRFGGDERCILVAIWSRQDVCSETYRLLDQEVPSTSHARWGRDQPQSIDLPIDRFPIVARSGSRLCASASAFAFVARGRGINAPSLAAACKRTAHVRKSIVRSGRNAALPPPASPGLVAPIYRLIMNIKRAWCTTDPDSESAQLIIRAHSSDGRGVGPESPQREPHRTSRGK